MKKLLTNQEIYEYALGLKNTFNNTVIELPVLINYSIQKNLHTLIGMAQTVDQLKNNIGEKYGVYDSEVNGFKILPENMAQAKADLEKLMEIEEKVEIRTIKLDDLKDIKLTNQQMAALLFMIEEE